jgi:DNA repair protein RecN (Recombination protein N)
MLRELKIANLALIDTLHLTFGPGLTVFTGETGAGKSIVLAAISLLAGGKTTAPIIRSGSETATVEALFEIPAGKSRLREMLADAGFETDGIVVIKRIINQQGRSRYYINDGLATARLAGELSQGLISVAGQREHQQLLIPGRHLDFIDIMGDLWRKRQEFQVLFQQWTSLKKECRELQKQEAEKERQRDFLSFQYNEIMEADISPDEDEILTTEKRRLKSADTLTQLGSESLTLFNETVLDALALIMKNMEHMGSLDESIAGHADEVADNYYQLEDHATRLHGYLQSVANDPARLETVDARLDLLSRLKRKYGGPNNTLAEVIAFAEQANQELQQLDDLDQQLHRLQRELTAMEKEVHLQAGRLSEQRRAAGRHLTEAIQKELHSLCIEQARFEIDFKPSAQELQDLDETGWDRPEFMFSANPGEPVKPLINIISGGELSRLLLAFKCILARKDMVETVLFDEVDSGIGGKAAEAVARKIHELAGHHQVLCITHLPQIAAAANAHLIVAKKVVGQRTQVSISLLPAVERPRELARMLAGDAVTEKTLRFAEELAGKHH